ncbi:MAG: adenylosuccinate synthetase, partial [Lachnospiraceae bacterium]|nr:adenylosuccinate synthetase [Lachnospiraceae bacterium]
MRKSKGHVFAVVGAQYGSEGKGVIVNYLANRYHVHVRTGGPNAGHSFIHKG